LEWGKSNYLLQLVLILDCHNPWMLPISLCFIPQPRTQAMTRKFAATILILGTLSACGVVRTTANVATAVGGAATGIILAPF
jgi:hypothetical protein